MVVLLPCSSFAATILDATALIADNKYDEERNLLVEIDSPCSKYYLGRLEYYGLGQKSNVNSAIDKLIESSKDGCIDSVHFILDEVVGSEDESKISKPDLNMLLSALQQKADAGDTKSAVYMALVNSVDKYGRKNYNNAYRYFSKAALEGDGKGQYGLYMCFSLGLGVEKNIENAQYWLGMAMQNNIAQATYIQAYNYEHGYIVDRDIDKAIELYEKASVLGVDEAKKDLERLRVK